MPSNEERTLMLPRVLITTGLQDTWGGHETGRAWLGGLPWLIGRAAAKWGLEVDDVFPGSNVSFVAPVRRQDGSRAVLKLNFPEEETRDEPAALRHWEGRGAVRLIDSDAELGALLMERIEPGDPLTSKSERVSLEVAPQSSASSVARHRRDIHFDTWTTWRRFGARTFRDTPPGTAGPRRR
jgi:hypothetical protein